MVIKTTNSIHLHELVSMYPVTFRRLLLRMRRLFYVIIAALFVVNPPCKEWLMRSPVLVGAICLIVSEVLFAGVGALVKHLSDNMSHAQLVFFRNFFALLVLLPWLVKTGPGNLKTSRPGLHLMRSLIGLLAMYCFFYVLANMPLAPAMMALHTAPFIVPVIAKLWLKETLTRKTLVAMLIGFVGVTLILQPGAVSVNVYAAIALFCACLVAINKCTIRKLSETEPSARIVFYFTAIATGVSIVPLPFSWQPIDTQSWVWLSLMGLLAASGTIVDDQSVPVGVAGQDRVAYLQQRNLRRPDRIHILAGAYHAWLAVGHGIDCVCRQYHPSSTLDLTKRYSVCRKTPGNPSVSLASCED